MKLLCFADLHIKDNQELSYLSRLSPHDYNAVAFLGDINKMTLEFIMKKIDTTKPIFGVLGNHDEFNTFDGFPIKNVNGDIIEVNGYRFVGIEGSFKYKNSPFPSFNQVESIFFTSQLPKADVIISHTSPFGINEIDTHSHIGLMGISQYIERYSPK